MSLQKFLIRGLMKLPESLLLRMAGGEPLSIDGRVMDPRVQLLAVQGAKEPSITTLDPVAARAATSQGFALLDDAPRANVAIDETTVPGPGGALAARLYRPKHATVPLPGLVYFHMGGCVIGDLDTCDTFCSILADGANCAVLSVDYRLAPEHKFPAAVDDALAAYKWAEENAASFGMEAGRIGVGGDSAGGYLSAVVVQQMKAEGGPAPALQLLIYPVTDMEAEGGSMESCGEVYPLTAEIMHWFIDHYIDKPEDRKDLRASPLKADDLSGLPPAIVVTAGFDPLRDQGTEYADRLKAAGVPVTYRCYDGLAHAFTAMSGTVPAAKQACEDIAADVKTALHITA